MSHSIENICTSQEFQKWTAGVNDFPGFINKGWTLREFRSGYGPIGKGWVVFDTLTNALLFKLSASY